MKIQRTPIAAAMVLMFAGQAHATQGPGENGSSQRVDGSSINLIFANSVGATGIANADANGKDGEPFTGLPPIVLSGETITGSAGASGLDVPLYGQNGGAGGATGGGQGGASVIGAISLGGVGAAINTSSSANGGNGGNLSLNTIEITDSTLIGGAGGAGGNIFFSSSNIYSGGPSSFGGLGGGGHGGGSVFGGISIGGAAGDSAGDSAIGGNGGDVTKNNITLTKVKLNGSTAAGGAGGSFSNAVENNYGGGGGSGGNGGGSVFGGISTGGAGGFSAADRGALFSANGGNGGSVNSNTIKISGSILTGGVGGVGGSFFPSSGNRGFFAYSGLGAGGHGGGSVFGGISTGGGAGRVNNYNYLASGGNGGEVSFHTIEITDSTLTGAAGGTGGGVDMDLYASYIYGAMGAAGHGGGSVFGGISTGGAGGESTVPLVRAYGGDGGDISSNTIQISGSTLTGAAGGTGGSTDISPTLSSGYSFGGRGAGGHGGGSVFGGISAGGAGGSTTNGGANSNSGSNGGNGGNISFNTINIIDSRLEGAAGGAGGSASFPSSINLISYGAGGAGGHGGGSVFGGISTGGAGGSSGSDLASGGNGGNIRSNTINIADTTLLGAAGGAGGNVTNAGGDGTKGRDGGSVFGGISTGGAGGYSEISNGGAGGDVTNNKITLSGQIYMTGDVYGGLSQGGVKGNKGVDGQGGLTNFNTIHLIGDQIKIDGSLYGGRSINGAGIDVLDPNYSSYYLGNTLTIQSGDFQLNGSIKNFQNYNWLIPENEPNGGVIIEVVAGKGTPVDISNTIHSVDVQATGNILNGGDQVTLITKVTGEPSLKPIEQSSFSSSRANIYIEQGFFIVYEAEMVTQDNGTSGNSLVLNVLDVRNGPDGKIHPESEEFLKGRIAQLAMVDQGADMISDGISYARASLRKENANIFAIVDGGSNKYKNGGVSTLKLNDFKFALGAAKAWKLENESVGMVAAFAEHGNGNYSSYNYFDYFEDTRGSGKVRYSGVGLMAHLDVANTDVSKVKNKPNIFDDKYGLYLDAALRTGHIKVDFHSADMVKGAGIEARYNTKSRYTSAMVGAGYVWTLDEKSAMDFYARYTYSRLNGKDIQVVDEKMNAGAAHSKRLRLGARYGYAYSSTTTPYAGIAWERNFTGDVTGSAYGFTIKETSLKGNTGMLEAGVMVKPKGADDPFSLRFGIQGYFGQRKGATADIRARYVF